MKIYMSVLKDILNFLLPPRCINCGKIITDENGLCADCFNEVTFISAPYCKCCGIPFAENWGITEKTICPTCIKQKKKYYRYARSAIKYEDISKNMILSFKFMDKTENAKIFAKWLKLAGADIFDIGADVLIPVPLHYKRLVKRRYNQAALLAIELGKLISLDVDVKSLIKIKSTKPQVNFSGKNRLKNIKDAFSVKYPENIKNKRVVLIDDVQTTGATLQECAKVLLQSGAKSVDFLTIARVYK